MRRGTRQTWLPVLHFISAEQRDAFAAEMAQETLGQHTLGELNLTDRPYEQGLPIVMYIMSGKDVAGVVQLPQREMFESLNSYGRMFHGNSMKLPHPVVPQMHGRLADYLGIPISNDAAFQTRIYQGIPVALPGVPPPPINPVAILGGVPGWALDMMRRVRPRLRYGEDDGDDDDDDDFDFVIEMSHLGRPLTDLSAPGPVAAKPEPKDLILEDNWEKILGKASEKAPECGACCTNYASVIMMPCRHAYYCDDCFRTMMKSANCTKECPVCRNDFKTVVRSLN